MTDEGEVEVFGPDEAIAKAISELSKKNKIHIFSDLTADEVNQVTIGFMVSNYLKYKADCEILEEMLKNFLSLRISLNRKGRNEIVGVASWNMGIGGGGEGKSKSITKLFKGFK